MIGGYQAAADALNNAYEWPDGRVISRQNVQAWDVRRTPNQNRQLPPSALDVPYQPTSPGRPPTRQFDPRHWVNWAAPGVPGQRNSGWVVPVPRG
jgi:hypothetical protein